MGNQYEEALIVFELLGSQQIKEKNLEFLCGHSHRCLKHYDLAIKHYRDFLKNHRSKLVDVNAAHNNLAILFYEMGRYEEALDHFRKMGDDHIMNKNYGFRVAHSLQNIDQKNM